MTNQNPVAERNQTATNLHGSDLPTPVNQDSPISKSTQQLTDSVMTMKATQIHASIGLYHNKETPYLDALGYSTIEGMMNALDGIQGETGVDREVLERVVMLGFNSGIKVSQALCEQLGANSGQGGA